jgi:hypothetical protein
LIVTRGRLKITKQKQSSKSNLRLIATIIFLPVLIPMWLIGWLLASESQKQKINKNTQPRRVYIVATTKQPNPQTQLEEPQLENKPIPA